MIAVCESELPGFCHQSGDMARAQFKQCRSRDRSAHDDGIVRQLPDLGHVFRLQIVQQAADDVVEIAAALAEVIVFKAVVGFTQIIGDLLYGPFRIDAVGFDFRDDAIHKQPILENQKMGVDEKRGFLGIATFQLGLHAAQLATGFLHDARNRATSPATLGTDSEVSEIKSGSNARTA
jgi:hypothetical protein